MELTREEIERLLALCETPMAGEEGWLPTEEAALLTAARTYLPRALREVLRLQEQLRPGSLTERAPTRDAYDAACLALAACHTERDRLRRALDAAGIELGSET